MPETDTVSNWVDFYAQQLVRSKDWSVLAAPLWNSIGEVTNAVEVSQRGVRFYFVKTQAGGHTLPSLSQPDFNRAIPSQSDSMWAVPQMYGISMVIDYALMVDAGGDRGPKKANAMFNIQEIVKQTVDAAAQHQEFFACGDGSGALAYSASTLTVVGAGQTLNCDITPDATPGHTKGAVRLKQNQYYQSYDPNTGLPEGTILVTSLNNKTSATVTLLSGVVTSGNPICDVGGYNAAPMGFSGCIDDNNRVFQGRDTTVDTVLNCPAIDLINTKFTVSDREKTKTQLVVLNIDKGARSSLNNLVTPGLMSDLRIQGYGFHRTGGDEPVVDIAGGYKDADGTRILEMSNWEEDRSSFFKSNNIQKHTNWPFGDMAPDDLKWRNLPGVNATGSRNYYRMWSTSWTLALTDPNGVSTVKRASLSGIVTQASVGMGA
jgi:hypothetical protein